MKRSFSLILVLLLLTWLCGCTADTVPVESTLSVPAIPGTDGDFIRGMDVSSLLAQLNSGVIYYDFEGNVLDGQGFMNLLADCGVNWIRLRVWNDPFDASGNGYGGGNCDLDAAVTMGKWASEAGMKVLIDFHYSDFWADPAKQQAPKAWVSLSLEEKATAMEAYTSDSLKKLLAAGVDVGMVQIGNEINNGLAGETGWPDRCRLLSAGSAAVREISAAHNKDIQIAVHFTDPQNTEGFLNCAQQLAQFGVDYDVFATSYYPFWHGTTENLSSVLSQIADTYGKRVMVAETSWPYTLKDGDGHTNSINEGNTAAAAYSIDAQGQAGAIADIVRAVKEVGESGIGVFCWEPAWIPVGLYDGSAESWEANAVLWENFGSGWASSHAGGYDPEDAGQWYGGSSWDNQALFDFEGHPLESLKIYLLIQVGTAEN